MDAVKLLEKGWRRRRRAGGGEEVGRGRVEGVEVEGEGERRKT